MPTYEYHCGECGEVSTLTVPYSERPEKIECVCGGEAEYRISGGSFILRWKPKHKALRKSKPKSDVVSARDMIASRKARQ